MKALVYLLFTTTKNRILSLKKKPALLVMYLLIAVGIAVMIITSMQSGGHKIKTYSDVRVLYAIVTGIGSVFIFSFVTTGLSTGSTLFTMADVGLLFVAPVSSKKILIYGLIKQMATTFLSAIFILYQVQTLKNSFGLGIGTIFNMFFIYAILIFFCQLMSIGIYIYSNGNAKRKNLVKSLLYGLFAVTALGIYYQYVLNGGSILNALLNLMSYKPFHCIPVLGWSAMFMSASVEGNMIELLVALSLFLLSSIVIIFLFTSGDADYYEDVLSSTEIVYNKLQDAKNGKRVVGKRNIKVKGEQTGLQGGKGCSAIFYKHLLEKKRTGRFVFLDTYSVLAAGGSGLVCYFINSKFSVYIVLGILVYIQFFATILGKLSDELSKPYIYMIPEKSIRKVAAASMTTMIKPCFDAVIIFTVVCIFSKTSPLLNLFLALAYASSGAIFVSYTLLCQRIFGGQPNKLISAMFGLILFMFVMAPGIGLSITAVLLLPETFIFLGTLPFTFCCIVISLFIFVVCGDLLDKAEYTGK
ncbi:MAG: putative ABC exporter domain-containing protein [Anaerocolumna sp.]